MQNKERFITRFIEYIILNLVLMIFFHSIYHVVYKNENFNLNVFSKFFHFIENHPKEKKRKISFLVIDVSCETEIKKITQANQIRIQGSLCSTQKKSQRNIASLKEKNEITVLNEKNHFLATIFKKKNKKQYSTDYISIEPGINLIHISMIDSHGNEIQQKIEIIKKEKN